MRPLVAVVAIAMAAVILDPGRLQDPAVQVLPVAPVPTTTTTSTTTTTAPTPLVSPTTFAEWSKVAACETGGRWTMQGAVYSGIGFLNSTWRSYGGLAFAPNAGEASPEEQILIAQRIEGSGYVPDQHGCNGPW
jgi:hypothetical protein